jgi:ABC-type nickel/cobalt efflux system permease component RcnA
LAFILGAGHALTPGHGKTIVAAYLVGTRGTPRHAIFLGLTTTVTHTAGVFLLGFITLAISRYVLPEQVYPWLEFASGAMVVVIGIALFRSRLLLLLQPKAPVAHDHSQNHSHDHDHSHDHGHDHEHNHSAGWLDHDHEHGPHTHTHDNDAVLADWATGTDRTNVSWRNLLALGISGGLIPCPSALVVLLGAIALGRVGFGLLLIVAFSIGLASVLTALGMVLVYARGFFEHLPVNSFAMRALPVASAVLVTLAGCVITYGGLVQAGIVRL